MDGGVNASDRSTSLHVSGRIAAPSINGDTHFVEGKPIMETAAAHELSQALSLFGKQLQHLNHLLLNGIPLQVQVSTPSPVNHVHVDAPSVNVQSPNVTVEPKIIVEPPFVKVDAPVVRVDNQTPVPKVENIIARVEPLLSRKELNFVLNCLIGTAGLLSGLLLLLTIILYRRFLL